MPNSVRGLSLLSQLAVYKDLVPGYRIRQLTEAEEAEKVRDEVKRMREGEKGLVRTYKAYLKTLETEIRSKCPGVDCRATADTRRKVTAVNTVDQVLL